MQPSQHQHQHADWVVDFPRAPPPSPAAAHCAPLPLSLPSAAQPAFSMPSFAVARGLINVNPHIHHPSTNDAVADAAVSEDSLASLRAIHDGVRGGPFQFPAQASHSTLETMHPFLSASELGEAIGEAAVGKDVGERARAVLERVFKLVKEFFSLKKKMPVQDGEPASPADTFEQLYAANKVALDADAVEADEFADAIAARQRADEVAQAVASIKTLHAEYLIRHAIVKDDHDGDGQQGIAFCTQLNLSVVVTDTDAAKAALRHTGRGDHAIGHRRPEWGPSMHMYDAAHLAAPAHAPARNGRPRDCPCGLNCFCITAVVNGPKKPVVPRVHPNATRCGGMVITPRFDTRPAVPVQYTDNGETRMPAPHHHQSQQQQQQQQPHRHHHRHRQQPLQEVVRQAGPSRSTIDEARAREARSGYETLLYLGLSADSDNEYGADAEEEFEHQFRRIEQRAHQRR